MACYYCNRQHVVNPDNGACVECNLAVCANPPVRLDKKFHADRCNCACGKLVCRYDAPQHAAGHGSSSPACFPAIVIALGGSTITTAITAAADDRSGGALDDDSVLAFNEFLNFASPGYRALGGAIQNSSDRAMRSAVRVETTPSGVRWYAFDAEFFSSGAIDKVVALASHTTARAWRSRPSDARYDWLSDDVQTVLEGSAVSRREVRLSPYFLSPFASLERGVPGRLQSAIETAALPERVDEIADWIADSRATVASLADLA